MDQVYDRANELATSARLASEKAITDAAAGKARADAAAAAAAAAAKVKADTAVREAGDEGRARGRRHPQSDEDEERLPVYPAVAKSARVGGTVLVEATIGPDGKVADARVLRSVALLDQAALDAVRQWIRANSSQVWRFQ